MKIFRFGRNIFFLFMMSCILCGCWGEKKKKNIAFYDDNSVEEVDSSSEGTVCVPFTEIGSVKYIDVTVNRQFTVKMILDSGCSGTLISIAEAKYLYEKGCFTANDIIGISHSQIADGSIVENMVINLKELIIGNQISCPNVRATVSANAEAPLLLGNEVLNRVPSYSVDNANKMILFHLQ